MKVVIVGSGMAGVGLASALRRAAPSFEVVIVTSERLGHYSRPLLSHGISREDIDQRIVIKTFESLVTDGVIVHAGATVNRVDRKSNSVIFCSDGKAELSVSYDRLVLATGSEAFIPAPWMEFREHFRTLNQLEELKDIRSLRTRLLAEGKVPRWAIVGGGLIGCEVASDARKAGDHVHLLHGTDRLMERQLDEAQSRKLEQHLTESGIRVDLNMKIASFKTVPGGKAVLAADGSGVGDFDIVLVATGFRPRIGLAKDAGLAVATGILTDAYLKTEDPAIFALGDVAQVEGRQVYPFVAPIRDQVSWMARFLTEQTQEPWSPMAFKPMAKIHGFRV